MPKPIGYAYRDPRTDYQPLPSWAELPLESKVRGWPHPLTTFRIGQAVVTEAGVLPVGVVVAEQWLCDCLQYLPPHWHQAPWMQRIAGHHLRHDRSGLRLEPGDGQEHADPVALQGSWCVLNDLVSCRNIAHFFRDELPQLAAIRELRLQHPDLQVLARPSRLSNINLMRERLIPGAAVSFRPYPAEAVGQAPVLQVESLLLQPLAFNGGQGFYPGFQAYDFWLALNEYRRGLALLRDALDPHSDACSGLEGAWICFSRDLHRATEAQQGRRYTNYPELLETLSNNGVIVLDPGHVPIDRLYSLIRHARGFIGIHGAALANALLAAAGTRVVEIRSYSGVSCNLELLGKAAGLDWRCVDTPRAADGSERGVIPIASIMALIQEHD